VLTAAVDGAHEAVAKTPSLLPILRDAGVVDAGGQGLYRLLQGTLRYLVSRASVPVVGVGSAAGTAAGTATPASSPVAPAEEVFGYETMFLLQSRGAPLDVPGLREALEKMG